MQDKSTVWPRGTDSPLSRLDKLRAVGWKIMATHLHPCRYPVPPFLVCRLIVPFYSHPNLATVSEDLRALEVLLDVRSHWIEMIG